MAGAVLTREQVTGLLQQQVDEVCAGSEELVAQPAVQMRGILKSEESMEISNSASVTSPELSGVLQ